MIFSALLATSFALTSAAPPLGYQPNIVFILTDDQDTRLGNATEYTKYGSLEAMSSVQEHLIGGGIHFENFFENTPICCPSRSEFFTGRYYQNLYSPHGNCMHVDAGPNVFNASGSMFSLLESAGYVTGVFGKVTNDQGSYFWNPSKESTWMATGMTHISSPIRYNDYDCTEYFVKYANGSKHVENISKNPPYGTTYQTAQIGNRTLDWLDEVAGGDSPFFAYVGPHAPHYPATPAPWYSNIYDDVLSAPVLPNYNHSSPDKAQHIRQNPPLSDEVKCWEDQHMRDRWATLRSVDDIVQGVIDKLTEKGVLNQTYIVYSSDHGYKLGSWRVGTSKQHPFETDIRAPFLIRGPEVVTGSESSIMAGNTDVLPTMLELAGATKPSFMDGKSLAHALVPSVLNKKDVHTRASSWRQHFLISYLSVGTYYNDHSAIWSNSSDPTFTCGGSKGPRSPPDVNPKEKCVESDGVGDGNCYFVDSEHSNSWRALRVMDGTDNLIYVEYDPTWEFNATSTGQGLQFYELYDIDADPYQLKNIYNETSPDKLTALHQTLASYFECSGADCP